MPVMNVARAEAIPHHTQVLVLLGAAAFLCFPGNRGIIKARPAGLWPPHLWASCEYEDVRGSPRHGKRQDLLLRHQTVVLSHPALSTQPGRCHLPH